MMKQVMILKQILLSLKKKLEVKILRNRKIKILKSLVMTKMNQVAVSPALVNSKMYMKITIIMMMMINRLKMMIMQIYKMMMIINLKIVRLVVCCQLMMMKLLVNLIHLSLRHHLQVPPLPQNHLILLNLIKVVAKLKTLKNQKKVKK